MKPILDQYGKPIRKETLLKVHNQGPFLSNSTFAYGFAGEYLNPDKVGINKYQEMYRADETVSSGIDFITLSVLARLGEYSHPDKKITDFILRQFERIHGSMYLVVEEILSTAIINGFSVSEMIFDVVDGLIQITDIQTLDPACVCFNLHQDGQLKNRVKGVKQTGSLFDSTSKNSNDNPIEKYIIYSHNSKNLNPYGTSRLRSIYPVYYVKKSMMCSWTICLERFGSPFLKGEVGTEAPTSIFDGRGEEIGIYDFLERTMSTIQAKTSIVVPEGVKIEAIQSAQNGTVGIAFEKIIDYCNKMIYRGLLIPGLTAATDTNGNRALGTVHQSLFFLGLKKLTRDITEILLDQLIRRLITWNFGEQETFGTFQTDEFDPDVANTLAELYQKAVNTGYLFADEFSDVNSMREKIGAQILSEESWKKRQATKEAQTESIRKRLLPLPEEPKIEKQTEENYSRSLNGLLSFLEEDIDDAGRN